MLNTVRRLPFLKILAVVQLALLARRHLQALTPEERHRMSQLALHGRTLTPAEREELRVLASKLEPRAYAGAVADAFSPFPLPKRVTRGPKRSRR